MDGLGIADRVKSAREKAGLTQEQLGDRLGLSRDFVSKIENGITQRPRNIKELGIALNVSPIWLAFGVQGLEHLSPDALDVAMLFDVLDDDKKRIVRAMLETLRDA